MSDEDEGSVAMLAHSPEPHEEEEEEQEDEATSTRCWSSFQHRVPGPEMAGAGEGD